MNMNEFGRNCAVTLSILRMMMGFPFAVGKGTINILRNKCFDKHGNLLVSDIEFNKIFMLPTAHLVERARQHLENARCNGAEDLDDFINDMTDFVDKIKEGTI